MLSRAHARSCFLCPIRASLHLAMKKRIGSDGQIVANEESGIMGT